MSNRCSKFDQTRFENIKAASPAQHINISESFQDCNHSEMLSAVDIGSFVCVDCPWHDVFHFCLP